MNYNKFIDRAKQIYDVEIRVQQMPWDNTIIVNLFFSEQVFAAYLTTEEEFMATFNKYYLAYLKSKGPLIEE